MVLCTRPTLVPLQLHREGARRHKIGLDLAPYESRRSAGGAKG
jgi:hypothetical protein